MGKISTRVVIRCGKRRYDSTLVDVQSNCWPLAFVAGKVDLPTDTKVRTYCVE